MSDVVSGLLTRLDEIEQCATAAGHGFGHLGLSRLLNLNAGWTQLDLSDNVRPDYDLRFVREFDPKAILGLVRAHRLIIDLHQRDVREVWSEDAEDFVDVAFCRKCAWGESCACCADDEDYQWPCAELRLLAEGWGVGEVTQ